MRSQKKSNKPVRLLVVSDGEPKFAIVSVKALEPTPKIALTGIALTGDEKRPAVVDAVVSDSRRCRGVAALQQNEAAN